MADDAGGARQNGHHLTKEELFEKLKLREEDFALPGGGVIRIRGLSVNHGALLLPTVQTEGEITDTIFADRCKRVCLAGIVDPPLEPEDLETLGERSANLTSEIAAAIIRLSGVDEKEAKDFFDGTPARSPSSSTARKRSTGSRQK